MRQYIDELDKKIIANFNKFTAEMRTDQQTLKNSLDSSISDLRSYISTSLKEFQNNVEHCNENIRNLETKTMSQISHLEVENNKIQCRFNRPDIVISGLPSGINDFPEPVLAICKHYQISAAIGDINHCLYIQQGKSILVKFNNVHIRDSIMKAYFKTPKLQLKDIINTDINSRVYLNDNFTSAAHKLHVLCRALRKDDKITWFRIMNRDIPLAKIKLTDGTEKKLNYLQCSEL